MAHVAFHNTTPLEGQQLLDAARAAAEQDAAVLVIVGSGGDWTPSQVHAFGVMAGRAWLLTSVRRAMSNLTKADHLVMTGARQMGPHGRPENTWRKCGGG